MGQNKCETLHPSSLLTPGCLSWCLRALSFPKVLSALGLARGRSLFLTSVKKTPLSFGFTHSFQSKSFCGSEAVFSSVSIVRANLSFHSKKSLTYKASVFQTPDSSSFAFTSSENYWSSVKAPKETCWKGRDLSLHPSRPRGSNSFQGHSDLCLPRTRSQGSWDLHAPMRGRVVKSNCTKHSFLLMLTYNRQLAGLCLLTSLESSSTSPLSPAACRAP